MDPSLCTIVSTQKGVCHLSTCERDEGAWCQAVTELKAEVLDPPYTLPRVDSLAATPHTCLGNGVGNLATDSVPLATDSAPTLGCTAPDVSCPDSKDGTDDKVTPAVVAAAEQALLQS